MAKTQNNLLGEQFTYFNSGLIRNYNYDVFNKNRCLMSYVEQWLNRLVRMFEYEGLPDTLPQREIELLMMTNGFGFITNKQNGKDLYCYFGGLGGIPDEYYFPTIVTIANPYQKWSAQLSIKDDEDGVLIKNDSMLVGVMPTLTKWGSALVENDITIRLVDTMARATSMITATDDGSKQSAEKFISDLVKGKMSVVATNEFLEGVKTNPLMQGLNSNTISQLIELEQYFKASCFIDLGIPYTDNMKRESLNDDEISANDKALLPLIDDMLHQRQVGWDRVNKKYGTNIKVKLTSAWKLIHDEIKKDNENIPTHEETFDNLTSILGNDELDYDTDKIEESKTIEKNEEIVETNIEETANKEVNDDE